MENTHVRSIQGRVILALVTALALIFGIAMVGGKANAAVVTPTVSNVKITDEQGTVVTEVNSAGKYLVDLDFTVPNGTVPGDSFTIELGGGFTPTPGETKIQGGKVVASGNTLTVTFDDTVSGMVGLNGHLQSYTNYTGNEPVGTVTKPTTQVNSGEIVPVPNPPSVGEPPKNDLGMAVNKWTNSWHDGVNKSQKYKLPFYGDFGGQWVAPVEGQSFVQWFVGINDWQAQIEGRTPELKDLGTDMVITDILQAPKASVTPALKKVDNDVTTKDIQQALVNRYFVGEFPKVEVREVTVDDKGTADTSDDTVTYRATTSYPGLNAQVDPKYYEITSLADGSTQLKVFIGQILKEQFNNYQVTKNTQINLRYITVEPDVPNTLNINRTALYNNATLTSTTFKGSDEGYYEMGATTGWIYGDQPRVNLTLNKTWKAADGTILAADKIPATGADFELLADGKPATGMDGNVLTDQKVTLTADKSTYMWKDLPTQSAENTPIKYTLKETVEGFTSDVDSVSYVADITDLSKVPARGSVDASMSVTNTQKPTPTSSTSATSSSTTSSSATSSSATSSSTTTRQDVPPVNPNPDPAESETSTTSPNGDNGADSSGTSSTTKPAEPTSATSVTSEPTSVTSEPTSVTSEPSVSETTSATSTPVVTTTPPADGPSSKTPWWLWFIPVLPFLVKPPAPAAEVPPAAPVVPETTVVTTPAPGPKDVVRQPATKAAPAAAPKTTAAAPKSLANTGADVNVLAGLAVLLIVAGAGAMMLRRREA